MAQKLVRTKVDSLHKPERAPDRRSDWKRFGVVLDFEGTRLTLRRGQKTAVWGTDDVPTCMVSLVRVSSNVRMPKKEAEMVLSNHYLAIGESLIDIDARSFDDPEARVIEAIDVLSRKASLDTIIGSSKKTFGEILSDLSENSYYERVKRRSAEILKTAP